MFVSFLGSVIWDDIIIESIKGLLIQEVYGSH